jgi:hypothetical protein
MRDAEEEHRRYVTKIRMWFIYYKNVMRHRGGKNNY